ncbi:MAG: AAA family ATPase, partial [Patescibacteria group bacterium]
MYLRAIEIAGFKSFAKKVAIEFKSAVTAIVGPNGSGKSNVAEAFSFVLGEQSIKSMRGKKGEDLIWNGSQEQARANRAVVKTVFDNSKKIFNIDFDEVSIERIVNRDGINEYLLNGSQVRLKDILELLAGAHIGASGHHIISQGEADRILTANTKERKVMLEDALGLKVYQYKRLESQRKLEKTFENIAQVESLRKEIAPHLRFLKKQVDKMSRATEIKEKLTKLYREYLKREKTYIDGEKVNIKNENDPLLKKEERIKREMEKAREILESSKKKDLKSDELLNIESRLRKEREKKDNLSREAGKLEGEIKTNEALLEKTLKKVEAGENITIALKEVEQLALEIENENEITEIKRKIREFLNNKKGNSEESFLRELQEIVSGLKKKKEEIENKITEVAKEVGNFEESYNQLRALLEKEKDSGRDAEKEMLRLSTEETLLRAQIEVLMEKERRLKLTET